MKKIARLAEKHGWPYSMGKVKKGKLWKGKGPNTWHAGTFEEREGGAFEGEKVFPADTRCPELMTQWPELRGGQNEVAYYKPLAWLEAVEKLEQELLDQGKLSRDRRWGVRATYISFGRPVGPNGDDLPFAIEGAIPQRGVTGADGMIELGWARGDFACNGLMYCSLNEALIDMSGNGVEDCQGKPPILRIPYAEEQWETWMHLYHRWINLWRWFKFRARGQVSSSNGAADMRFVCEQLAKHCGDEELRQTFVNYMEGEAKQKSDAQKMEYARKLHGVFCDDYANAMGVDDVKADGWFKAKMAEWMPLWFKEATTELLGSAEEDRSQEDVASEEPEEQQQQQQQEEEEEEEEQQQQVVAATSIQSMARQWSAKQEVRTRRQQQQQEEEQEEEQEAIPPMPIPDELGAAERIKREEARKESAKAEQKTKKEAEEKVMKEAEEKVKKEAEEKVKKEAEAATTWRQQQQWCGDSSSDDDSSGGNSTDTDWCDFCKHRGHCRC
jgi:hypothetical protein